MNNGKCRAYFAQLKVQSVGGGVREEMGVMDFTALGKKLCFTLFVWVVMYLRGTSSWCPGRMACAAIRQAFGPGCDIMSRGVEQGSPQSPVQFSPPRPRSFCLVQCSFCTTLLHTDRECSLLLLCRGLSEAEGRVQFF